MPKEKVQEEESPFASAVPYEPPSLCIVIPTLNEAGNVVPLCERLEKVLKGISWEAIFVDDDSTDGTRVVLTSISRSNPRIRFIHRINRRGLSSACVEGMLASTAPYLVAMDADLQHDEGLIPGMLKCLAEEPIDIVLGSRFADAKLCTGLSRKREKVSEWGNRIANQVVGADLTDPLTGFFGIRRDILLEAAPHLSLKGFKIVVDILASTPRKLRYKELPMRFRSRQYGSSKLDTAIYAEFLFVLADKLVCHLIPVRFLIFVLVGTSGMLLHFVGLSVLYRGVGLPFLTAQVIATYAAMSSNFTLNNSLTYHDVRLRGAHFFYGLISFCLVCSVGAAANFFIADALFAKNVPWALAGLLGAGIGAIWNYGVSSTFTWQLVRKLGVPLTSPSGFPFNPSDATRDYKCNRLISRFLAGKKAAPRSNPGPAA